MIFFFIWQVHYHEDMCRKIRLSLLFFFFFFSMHFQTKAHAPVLPAGVSCFTAVGDGSPAIWGAGGEIQRWSFDFFFPSLMMQLLMWYSKVVLSHNIQYYPMSWCFHHLQSMFKQQLKILQQARVVQNQKLKMVRELYEQFVKVTMSDLTF